MTLYLGARRSLLAQRKIDQGVATYSDLVLEDAPTAYWKMDEMSGTVMLDSSGNGHHGVYGALANLGAPPLIPSGTGIEVTEYGTEMVASVQDDAALRLLSDFTLEINLKPFYVYGEQYLLTKEHGGVSYSSWCFLLYDRRPTLILRSANGGANSLVTGPVLDAYAKYHVVAKLDDGIAEIYLNGGLVAASPFSGTVWASPAPIGVGCRYSPGSGTGSVRGLIDEAAIYGYGLSAERIAAHAAAAG